MKKFFTPFIPTNYRYPLVFLLSFLCFAVGGSLSAQMSLTLTPTAASCPSNGKINVCVSGGVPLFVYNITNGSNINLSIPSNAPCFQFQGLPGGAYTVTVTGGNGATATQAVTVADTYTPLTFSSPTVNNCCITVNAAGGRPPYTYAIAPQTIPPTAFSAPQGSNIFCGLAVGTYNLRIYDSCNNFVTTSATVGANTLLLNNPVCEPDGISNYNVSIAPPSNGTAPFTYTWVSGTDTVINSTGIFSGMTGCTYDLFVRDACQSLGLLSGLTACAPAPGLQVLAADCTNGSVSVQAVGGVAPYTYQMGAATNNTGTFTGLVTGVNSYMVSVTDACGKTATVLAACTNVDSVSYDCTQQCGFLTNISLCTTPSLSGAFPIQYTCLSCSPVQTLIQNSVGSCVIFNGLPGGSHDFQIQDAFGTTLTRNIVCNPDTLSLNSTYYYGCAGQIVFDVLSQNVFYPVLINCLTCGGGGTVSVNSFPYTFTGVYAGQQIFEFTDACGYMFTDTVDCVVDSIDANITYTGGCPGDVVFELTDSLPAYPITYTCVSCSPQLSITSYSSPTVLQNVPLGTQLFSMVDSCGNATFETATLVNPPLSVSGTWQSGCPGSIVFTLPTPYPVMPLTYHCANCGQPDIVSSSDTVIFPNIVAGIDTFTISDSCGNVFVYHHNAVLPSYGMSASDDGLCPATLTITPDSNFVSYPFTVSCPTCVPAFSPQVSGMSGTLAISSLCAGTYPLVVSDACGTTINLPYTLPTHQLPFAPVYLQGCPGSISITTNNPALCYPIVYDCFDCPAPTSQSAPNDTTPVVWVGVTVGSTYHFKQTDACGQSRLDSFTVVAPPFTATAAVSANCPYDITVTPTPNTFNYPVSGYCMACATPSTTAFGGNLEFLGNCPGQYEIALTDACGLTDTLNVNIQAVRPADSNTWDIGCPGNVTFYSNLTGVCYPVLYQCLSCGAGTVDTLSASAVLTMPNVPAGQHIFNFTDACGNVFTDTLHLFNPPLDFSLLADTNCLHTLTALPNLNNGQALPLTYSCQSCNALPITSSSSVDFNGLCPGSYQVTAYNGCGDSLSQTYVISPPNFSFQTQWTPGCPGSLNVSISGSEICFPLNFHCGGCGINDTSISAYNFTLPNITPGQHSFTFTDNCNQTWTQNSLDTLPPLLAAVSCLGGCPNDVSLVFSSSTVALPVVVVCTDCLPVQTFTSNSPTMVLTGIGSGTHTYEATDACGRQVTITNSCTPDTIRVTATPYGCDSIGVQTSPASPVPTPIGYFTATPLFNPLFTFGNGSNTPYITGLNQGTYVVSVNNPQGCVVIPDTTSTNYALFTLYQLDANGNLIPLGSNYTGSFDSIPPGNFTIVPTFCDTTNAFPSNGSGSGAGGGGGGGGGAGGGGGGGSWSNPFFAGAIWSTCREIYVKSFPTDTVDFVLKNMQGATLGNYQTTANDTIAYFANLQPNTFYEVSLFYGNFIHVHTIRTDSMPDVVLDPTVVVSCDSVSILLPDTTSGFVYYLQDAATQTTLMSSTNGTFWGIPPGDYLIVGTRPGCDSAQVPVHIDPFDPVLYSLGNCDSLFAWVPNRTGLTFWLYNAVDTFSNMTGVFTQIPAGTYTLKATHPYCGEQQTTVTLGDNLLLTSNLISCDTLQVNALNGNNLTFSVLQLNTPSPYSASNATGYFPALPAGQYEIMVSHPYCNNKIDTVEMGVMPAVIATKVSCDSLVVTTTTPVNNLIYAIYNNNYAATNSTGLFGNVPLGLYTVKVTHPQCNSDSTTIQMGGINPLSFVQPLCDSVAATVPFFTSITYVLTDSSTNALVGMNTTGSFGGLAPGTYRLTAAHPNCGADTLYVHTGVPPVILATNLACDSVQISVPGYATPFVFSVSGTANNGTVVNFTNNTGYFGSLYAGTYTASATHPNCGTGIQNFTVGGVTPPLVTLMACDSIQANVPGFVGIVYTLQHQANLYPDTTNTTGIFHQIQTGNYTLIASHPYCGTNSSNFFIGGIPAPVVTTPRCDSISALVSNVAPPITYTLQTVGGVTVASNTTGGFNQVPNGNYVVIASHPYCGTSAANVSTNNLLPPLQATIVACDSILAEVPGYTNITYQIQGSTNSINLTNTSGQFGGLTPNVYTITATHPHCGTLSTTRVLNNIPPMLTNQTACDAILVNVPGISNITYNLQEVNNLHPPQNNSTGVFYPVDSGYYLITATHPNCGTVSQNVNMGGIPAPVVAQKTCDSIVVSVSGFGAGTLIYLVSNGAYTAANSTGLFGGLPTGTYTVTATHPHCGSSQTSITLTDAPIQPVYCVRPMQKDSAGVCKFVWRLSFDPGQHTFKVVRNGQIQLPLAGQPQVFDLFPDAYFIYDSLQCNGIWDTFPNPNVSLTATPVYCPNQGCLQASGGRSNAQWQAWAATTGLPICGSIGDDLYLLQNPPVGVNPVTTNGIYCGLVPGQTYKVFLYSQYSYSQAACRTDSVLVTMPTFLNPSVSAPPVVLCTGATTADLVVNVSGLYPPITYELLNPPVPYSQPTMYVDTMSTSAVFYDLPSGIYTVRVSACGISAVSTGVIFAAPFLAPDYDYYCDSSLHLKTLCLAGATYTWTTTGGALVSNQCNPVLTNISGGTYFLSINTPNCTLLQNAPLNVPPFSNPLFPTPSYTVNVPNGFNPPIPITLQVSNLLPPNYWSVSAITQVPVITGTILSSSINAAQNQIDMTVSQQGDYFFDMLLSSENGQCVITNGAFVVAQPLPVLDLDLQVELIDQQDETAAELKWKTTGNVGEAHFVVERVDAAGVATSLATNFPTNSGGIYRFVDSKLPELDCGDSISYRVTAVSNNGEALIGDQKSLTVFPQSYYLYPNPATDWLHVKTICYSTNDQVQPSLWDVNGREMPLSALRRNGNYMDIYVKDLPEGVYFLRIRTQEGKTTDWKFVKR